MKKIKKTVLLVFLLAFFSCKKAPIDKGVLSENQMTELLVDLFIYKQMAALSSEIPGLLNTDEIIKKKVFKKHRTTKEQFEKSHGYYFKKNEDYLEIIKKAENRIKELEGKIKK